MDKSKKGGTASGNLKIGPDGRPITVNSTSPSKHFDRTGSYSDVMNAKVQKSSEAQDEGADTSSEKGEDANYDFLNNDDDSNEFYELNAHEDSAANTHATTIAMSCCQSDNGR